MAIAKKSIPVWLKADYPTPQYTIRPGDVLEVRVVGTTPDQPIDGYYAVERGGTLALGPTYGRARVGSLTLEAAETAIEKQLSETLSHPTVQVTLPCWNGYETPRLGKGKMVAPDAPDTIGPGERLMIRVVGTFPDPPIDGYFQVEPQGTIALGPKYGRVRVQGLSIEQSTEAIVNQLKITLQRPDVEVTRPMPSDIPPHEFTWRETPPPTASYTIAPGDVLQVPRFGDYPRPADRRLFPGRTQRRPRPWPNLWPGAGQGPHAGSGGGGGREETDRNPQQAAGPSDAGRLEGLAAEEAVRVASVKGLTLHGAENAITEKLAELLTRPEVSVTLSGWETDRYLPTK